MNLYLLTQSVVTGYSTYDSAVVAADDEAEVWVDGAWFSNSSYMDRPKVTTWWDRWSQDRLERGVETFREQLHDFTAEDVEDEDTAAYYESLGFEKGRAKDMAERENRKRWRRNSDEDPF